MVLAILVYPFPYWVVQSGYIMFAGTVGLLLFLILLKTFQTFAKTILGIVHKILPARLAVKVETITEKFLSGIVALRTWHDYITLVFLSAAIWLCYGLILHFSLHAFGFIETFRLPWHVSLILLVITSVAVVVPSSPGYIGPYHYLCQITLAMFGVPPGPALSYATVAHGICFLPVLLLGLALANYEGVSLYRNSMDKTLPRDLPEAA
jgi:hypothetical protein